MNNSDLADQCFGLDTVHPEAAYVAVIQVIA